MKWRDVFHFDLSSGQELVAVGAMQTALVGFLFVGLWTLNVGVFVNTLFALGVTFLPGLFEHDYSVPLDAGLVLWITGAVFLHAWGTVGLPGIGSFYANVWWWDHLTHTLSATLVAAVGYSVARALDEHTESIYLPDRFMFVFILLFVVAAGVFWEVVEFLIGLAAGLTGADAVLTQYGLRDSMMDLLFNTAGGVVVALWGSSQLSGVVEHLVSRLDSSRPRNG
ncbi:hypothetical protein SAMN04488063_1939 [Halopelagius inordinatus]|uniref:Uncharacterized protein n=1 Tax=Halopelagius inordinatus TaxID=553467 RepID=A0A1I2RS34_9EURY|nr:hypothetical protein SAMN04488063_1939 [Halopelagius inordinatus]